jgi:hypothetical protein
VSKDIIDVPAVIAAPISGAAESWARTGVLASLATIGTPVVELTGNREGVRLPARTCVPLLPADVGKTVVLVFEADRPDSPIVVGVLRVTDAALGVEVTANGKSVSVTATESVVLKCGAATITLKADGTIAVRGTRVVSHASGVNRILGGSVELN